MMFGKLAFFFNIKKLSFGTLQSAVHAALLKHGALMFYRAYFVCNIGNTLKFSTFSG